MGIASLAVAAVLVTSSLTVLYYSQYQQQNSQARAYQQELNTTLSEYGALNSSYREALQGYNQTILLLSQALSNLNTSSPAYVAGSQALATLWQSYLKLSSAKAGSAIYSVNVLFGFGNGTRRWYNDTAIQPGWSSYVTTLVLLRGNVLATWYPLYGEHFVLGLDGVVNNPSQHRSWFLWTWDKAASWKLAEVGPDEILMHNGSVVAWSFCGYDPLTYAPSCKSP